MSLDPSSFPDGDNVRMPEVSFSKPHFISSALEWEQHRPLITRLYQVEKRKLKEVMTIMETTRSLKATEKMYKTRIKAWGLEKKNKRFEIEAILHARVVRDAAGKGSQFILRGRPVDLDDVERYRKRKSISLQSVLGCKRFPNETPTDLICITPPRVASPLLIPPTFRIIERFLHNFSVSLALQIESLQLLHGIDKLHTEYSRARAWIGVTSFYLNIMNGCDWFQQGYMATAGFFWRLGFLSLENHIVQQHAEVMIYLIDALYSLENRSCGEVASALRRYLSETTKLKLPSSHPRYQMCADLMEFSQSGLRELSQKLRTLTLEKLTKALRNSSFYCGGLQLLDLPHGSSLVHGTCNICEISPALDIAKLDAEYWRPDYCSSNIYIRARERDPQLEEAENVARELLRRNLEVGNGVDWSPLRSLRYWLLGDAQHRQGKYEEARVSFIESTSSHRRSMELYGNRALSYSNLSTAYHRLKRIALHFGKDTEAKEWLRLAVKEDELLHAIDPAVATDNFFDNLQTGCV